MHTNRKAPAKKAAAKRTRSSVAVKVDKTAKIIQRATGAAAAKCRIAAKRIHGVAE